MNKFLALLAFVTLAAFIGILVMGVPRWDLGLVAALVVVLVAVDFLLSARDKPRR